MRGLTCKAYGPTEDLEILEWDDPAPDEGEIVVDVAAAGINFPDILSIAGQYQDKTPTPFIPGNEASGIVSAVGAGVTDSPLVTAFWFLRGGEHLRKNAKCMKTPRCRCPRA